MTGDARIGRKHEQAIVVTSMAVSDQQQTAAMTTMPSEVDQLKTQVTLLIEQVVALMYKTEK